VFYGVIGNEEADVAMHLMPWMNRLTSFRAFEGVGQLDFTSTSIRLPMLLNLIEMKIFLQPLYEFCERLRTIPFILVYSPLLDSPAPLLTSPLPDKLKILSKRSRGSKLTNMMPVHRILSAIIIEAFDQSVHWS